MHACQVASVVSNSATAWTVAHQAPLSMEFSRQEYWSGLPCLLLSWPLPSSLAKKLILFLLLLCTCWRGDSSLSCSSLCPALGLLLLFVPSAWTVSFPVDTLGLLYQHLAQESPFLNPPHLKLSIHTPLPGGLGPPGSFWHSGFALTALVRHDVFIFHPPQWSVVLSTQTVSFKSLSPAFSPACGTH